MVATNGAVLAACTAGATGMCIVQHPNELSIVVTEHTGTVTGGVAPRENPISTEVRTEFAGALFINLPAEQPALTFALEPAGDRAGEMVSYLAEGYTPGGEVTVVMTGDGLIVAEDTDVNGATAGSFQAPDRGRLTGESTNDIPIWDIDEATGREPERTTRTYVMPMPTPPPTPEPVVGRTCSVSPPSFATSGPRRIS